MLYKRDFSQESSYFINCSTIIFYLKELSNWANTYINDSDELSSKSSSFKVNMVFYSVCQAIFYLIAFRARDLTINEKSKYFLFLTRDSNRYR